MRNTTISIAAPKALSASENGAAVDVSAFHGLVDFVLSSSETGGADETSTVKIQHSDNGSTGWADTGVAFAAVTNAAASLQVVTASVDGLKKYVRAVHTLAGSTPNVTSAVLMAGKRNYA